MAENTKIEWATHTFNPWIGCTEVSPGCDNCYARELAKRYGWTEWGAHQPRVLTKDANWAKPITWNYKAGQAGRRDRVFCASLADVFDPEVPPEWRERLWALIAKTPNLDWLLLTKRPSAIRKMLPENWGQGWPNVWLGTSVEDQARAWRIEKLIEVPAVVRFLSCEPLLGPLDLFPLVHVRCGHGSFAPEPDSPCQPCGCWPDRAAIDWVIVGGESGVKGRPMSPQWARDLRDQCVAAGVAYHFKQWGEWAEMPKSGLMSNYRSPVHRFDGPDGYEASVFRLGKYRTGRLLDGRTWDEMPEVAR